MNIKIRQEWDTPLPFYVRWVIVSIFFFVSVFVTVCSLLYVLAIPILICLLILALIVAAIKGIFGL